MKTLQFSSLSFDVSFQEIFSTIATGGALVLVSEEQRRDPQRLWEVITGHSVARMFLPFVALQQISEVVTAAGPESALRHVVTAGEQLQMTPSVIRFIDLTGAALHNQYGPTETHIVTQWSLNGAAGAAPSLPPIGRAITDTTMYVLDDAMRPVPTGISGQLYVGGVALARGYVDRPAATAERFVPNPFGPGRLYRTGDAVRWRHDGELQYFGRLDTQVKLRGFRIEPGEIETILTGHPAIAEAAVVVREVSAGDRRLVAYVVPRGGHEPEAADLLAFVARSVPAYMVPAAVAVLSALPLTASGKLDRAALPAPDFAIAADASRQVAPRTAFEEEIADIWREILAVPRIGVRDDFFTLGGHSLLATQVVSRLRKKMRVEMPLRQFFEAPTIEGVSRGIVLTRLHQLDPEISTRLLAESEHLTFASHQTESTSP